MVYENNEGQVTFVNVIDHAPLAKAGVQNNMTLLAISGEELVEKDLHELNALLVRREGTRLTLLVQDDGEPYEVVVIY
jgi:C-terminal processing protease CtpA/Prc